MPSKQYMKMTDSKTDKIFRIEACEFQREQNSDWEKGLLLNEGDLGIVDQHGNKIETCWTWRRGVNFALYIGWLFDPEVLGKEVGA